MCRSLLPTISVMESEKNCILVFFLHKITIHFTVKEAFRLRVILNPLVSSSFYSQKCKGNCFNWYQLSLFFYNTCTITIATKGHLSSRFTNSCFALRQQLLLFPHLLLQTSLSPHALPSQPLLPTSSPVCFYYLASLTASPVHLTASPVHLTASPVHLTASPVHLKASPVHLTASPVHLTASPVHLRASPVHLTASPVHLTASPVHLTGSLLSNQQTLSSPSNRLYPGHPKGSLLSIQQALSCPFKRFSPVHPTALSCPSKRFSPVHLS